VALRERYLVVRRQDPAAAIAAPEELGVADASPPA